jgi:Pyruvate/2-oxoacid:ferredoxin oxidoreductase gamma subunit
MGMEKSANIAIASFCCLTELNIAFKNINESIKEQFKEKGEEIIKKNIAIVRKIYESHQRSQSGNFKK